MKDIRIISELRLRLRLRILKLLECGNWITLQDVHTKLNTTHDVTLESEVFLILYNSPPGIFQMIPTGGGPMFRLWKPSCNHPECVIKTVLES